MLWSCRIVREFGGDGDYGANLDELPHYEDRPS